MIGELEIEEAIKDASIDHRGGDALAYLAAGIQLALVQFYANRYAETAEHAEKPYKRAAAGGFLLGFELGVRAARLERATV